jgi:hypothetical protein
VSEKSITRQHSGSSDGTMVPLKPRKLAQRPALATNCCGRQQNQIYTPRVGGPNRKFRVSAAVETVGCRIVGVVVAEKALEIVA